MKDGYKFLHPDTKIKEESEKDHPIYWIAEYISRINGVTVYHLKMSDKIKGSRKREYVIPRQLAMYFAKEYQIGSLKYIGEYFGNRNHETVISALKRIKGLVDSEKAFKAKVLKMESELMNIQGKKNPAVSGISKELRKNIETLNQIQSSL